MVQKIDRQELQIRFLAALQGTTYRFIEGLNPFHILLGGTEYWIYIKNLTSAHFENPDVWRAQLPQRDDFESIKESEADFILLGYDGENDIYATWNPVWVKQRLNSTGNLSFYSRYSLQQEARNEMVFKRLELSNEGEVVVFPRELTRMFFANVSSYFLAEGDYVAMGSKRRPEANESFKTFTDSSNVADFARFMADEKLSQVTISNYCRVIKSLLSDGTISRNRKLFLRYDFLTEYRLAVPQFVDLGEVREKNEKWHNLISAALNSYIDYLTQAAPEITSDCPISRIAPYSSRTESIENLSPTPVVRDWEAEYTDAVGKLTRIANPELIDIVQPYLDTEYPKKVAALNAVERFYGNRFPAMTLYDWGTLLNAINWSNPYAHDEPEATMLADVPAIAHESLDGSDITTLPKVEASEGTRAKIRITFPDGHIIQPSKVLESLLEVVKYADPEKVRELNIICCGDNLILKNPAPCYQKSSKSIGGGWFCNTCSSTRKKLEQIQYISDKLKLGVTAEIV